MTDKPAQKTEPAHKVARDFCIAYLGRDCFAPFTGQDTSAWQAFVYLVEMYGRSDENGCAAAIVAMRAVLSGAQNKECVHQVFCQAIPAILDWKYVPEIWSRLLRSEHWFGGTNWNLSAVTQVTEKERQRRVARERARWERNVAIEIIRFR